MGVLPWEVKVVILRGGGDWGGLNHASGRRGRGQRTDWSKSWSTENSRWFYHEWMVNESFRLEVLSKIHDSDASKKCKNHKVYIVSMVMRGKIVKLSVLCKINLLDPRFHFCFQCFIFVDWNNFTKRYLKALALNLNYMWAWSLLIYFILFDRFICNNVCREVGSQSIEPVKLRYFLYLCWGDFLEFGVFCSTFEHTSKKFFIFISSFNFSVALLYFPS